MELLSTSHPDSEIVINPVETPWGTSTTSSVLVWDCIVAKAPLKLTILLEVKPLPMMVMIVPTGPEIGENDIIECVGVHGLVQLTITSS